jgi:FKBP-type peptidyl-prolyl cis-trans isomerase FklB
LLKILFINVKKVYPLIMKNIFLTILAVFTVTVLLGCQFIPGASKEKTNFDKDSSYSLGLVQGTNFRQSMIDGAMRPDFNEFLKGLKDGMFGKKTRFSVKEAIDKINVALEAISEERYAIVKEKGIAYLTENSKKPGVKTTTSGLQYEVFVEGKGKKPVETDSVKAHLDGALLDGTIFITTHEAQPPQPETISLADPKIFPALKEGLLLMTVGSKYRFYIPYELGYGAEGYTTDNNKLIVPPYSVLLLVVELDSIVSKKAAVQEDEWGWGY